MAKNKILDKVIDYYEDDSDNTKNFVGNPPPGAPDGARPGDFYTDKNGQVWVKQATLLNSQGIPIKQSNGGWSPQKRAPNAGRITSNPLVDDGKKYHIFGEGGVKKTAEEFNKEFLGEIPINSEIAKTSDNGKPIVEEDPNCEISKIYIDFAYKIKSTYLLD